MGWRARRAVALAARYLVLDVVVDLDLVLDLVIFETRRLRRGGPRPRTPPRSYLCPVPLSASA